MGKVWVLDTETKGTGAEMVPLEKALRRSGPNPRIPVVRRSANRRRTIEPATRQPWRFKVVDVMTKEVLAEDADVRATVELLGKVPRMVDVTLYVWDEEAEHWRLLSLSDQKAIWALRGE